MILIGEIRRPADLDILCDQCSRGNQSRSKGRLVVDHQPDARCLCVALSRHPKLHFISSAFAAPSWDSTLDVAFAFRRHRIGIGRRVSFSSLSDGRRAARDSASKSLHNFRRVGSLDILWRIFEPDRNYRHCLDLGRHHLGDP